MSLRFSALLLTTVTGVSFAIASHEAVAKSRLPAIKASQSNTVPACVTPGRLLAYINEHNPRLAEKFKSVTTEYMRHGEVMNLRWDYAVFQMLVETGFLKYTGDVKPHQNNFAGLGATGGGVRGESFSDVASGVKAHLQHLQMYAGDYVDSPVAERTRKIQDWKILEKWQRKFSRPITFSDMGAKWAPGSRGYTRDIAFVGDRFFKGACKRPDPKPELVAIARGGTSVAANSGGKKGGTAEAPKRSKEAVREAVEQNRLALGGNGLKAGSGEAKSGVTILNGGAAASNPETTQAVESPETKVAGLAGAANATKLGTSERKAADSSSNNNKCRVWTASYGGNKAVIIKANDKSIVNYTVLKVNDGREKREADAYILAYANGGTLLNEYSNPNQALEKAFELCPEG